VPLNAHILGARHYRPFQELAKILREPSVAVCNASSPDER